MQRHGNSQETTVPLKPLSDLNYVSIISFLQSVYFFVISLRKRLAHFLFIRSNVETSGNKRFSSRKNHGISSTLGLLGYHCKSGVVIFAWRVTCKYANIPLKGIVHLFQKTHNSLILQLRITTKLQDVTSETIYKIDPVLFLHSWVFFNHTVYFLKTTCKQCRNPYYAL